MQDIVYVALTTDDNYAQHTAVVVSSILKNSRKKIHFYIVHSGLTTENASNIRETALSLDVSGIDFIDIDFLKIDFAQFHISGHINIAAYFRLVLPNVLPEFLDKVIYLDTDLIVLDDLYKLWEFNLLSYPIAAVPDYGIMSSKKAIQNKSRFINILSGESYFNSGVLVINLKIWREFNYTEKLIQLIQTSKYQHHDQDALNQLFKNNWMQLPLNWNVIPPVFYLLPKLLINPRFRRTALEAKRNISILHYAGRNKPWQFKSYKGFNDKYYYYLSLTHFKHNNQIDKKKRYSIYRQLFKLFIAKLWIKIF